MFVEKNTSGQWPVCTSAPTSVPTAPASSGLTCSHEPVGKPGVEICWGDCVACALLWTCQPPRPTVWVSAEAASAAMATVASRASVAVASRVRRRRAARRDMCFLPVR